MTTADVVRGPDGHDRCGWVGTHADLSEYHDLQWGRPVHGQQVFFERMTLEAFQSGLSWLTILRKRAAFARAFVQFDAAAVAQFTDRDVQRLLADVGIVRNRAKIEATVANARAIDRLRAAAIAGELADVGIGDPDQALEQLIRSAVAPYVLEPAPAPRLLSDIPATTAASAALAKELKRRGFRFVGPTTAYALMQATGLVNDHLGTCWVRTNSR